MVSARTVALLPLLFALAGCALPTFPTEQDIANSLKPTIRPGQAFDFPSEHHLTLSGDYRLPSGTYDVYFFGCSGVNYRIDEPSGTRHGTCAPFVNPYAETNVTGPGTLAIDLAGRHSVNISLK